MTIAVHIADPDIQNDINSSFLYNCFSTLAANNPNDHFIFIFDKAFSPLLITEKNITPVLSGPATRNRMLQYYFYNFKIPKLLSKYNATFFVSAEVCSLRTNVPQCLLIKDLSFLNKQNLYPGTEQRYLKKYLKHFVRRSELIVVFNPSLKATLVNSYKANIDKIHAINMGIADDYKPLSYTAADEIREKITAGKNYFLFFSTPTTGSNMIIMLKAFSIFKKWQKSNMQLVVLSTAKEKTYIKELASYKYRDDVKILQAGSVQVAADIIASSYAAIYLPSMEITGTEGLHALACEIPLISPGSEFCKSIYKEAALYCKNGEKEIADQMMLLYKDETLRHDLIQKGRGLISTHKWQYVAESLLKTMQSNPDL